MQHTAPEKAPSYQLNPVFPDQFQITSLQKTSIRGSNLWILWQDYLPEIKEMNGNF